MSEEELDYHLGGVHALDDEFRIILARALSNLPKEIIEWATDKLFFISDTEECHAFYLSKKDWKHKRGFIFLSNNLKNENLGTQVFSIAHEIAHANLDHRSVMFNPNMTVDDMQRQEKEANRLARKWLNI